jgi:hypothetical protein
MTFIAYHCFLLTVLRCILKALKQAKYKICLFYFQYKVIITNTMRPKLAYSAPVKTKPLYTNLDYLYPSYKLPSDININIILPSPSWFPTGLFPRVLGRAGWSSGSTPDILVYMGGAWLESRPGYWLSWLKFFVVFPSSAKQMPRLLLLGHYNFLPNPFHLSIHWSSYHPKLCN